MINVNGDIFIIPNQLTQLSEFWSHGKEQAKQNIERMGFECSNEETLVEVWMTGEGCENWQCHQSNNPLTSKYSQVASYLPLSLFEGKSEGDSVLISFTRDDGTVVHATLVLNQLGFRYRRFGAFEEVLSALH